jgi:hypothetical protein
MMTVNANFERGYDFDVGQGVKKNRTKAEHFYLLAARKGHMVAQFNLAQMCSEIQTKPKQRQAAIWWSKAALQGDKYAQANLGYAYECGNGVKRDVRKAKHYYKLAARQGDVLAQFNLILLTHRARPSMRTHAQFKEIIPRLKRAACNPELDGDAACLVSLAKCAYHGWGMRQSFKRAAKWYREAAKKCDVDAFLGLAFCYEDGEGVDQDVRKARQLRRFATVIGQGKATRAMCENIIGNE